MIEDGFMNIQDADPDIIVDLKYATTDNFTGRVIYDFTTAIARTGTAKKLGKAAKALKQQGFRIKVWDAYRPVEAQEKLFEVVSDPTWVAEPNPNYSHQKGVTFDLTLTDLNGQEVEMQTGFDDFTGKAVRDYPRTATQEKNYQTLLAAMTAAGFVGYENEWWDYRDAEMDQYGPLSADPNDYAKP
ncbi:D-alanyl-D-alanine dipeptidase [Secundilactobacillus pentosiphilus]|uniref:D-alanyl-D-alanine dipeptidase n=1 Tax=Secundilactobacillus pentosiphilus TaxID=1714682 RepID=A0A1Z5IP35_9LACO|nr:M15 family metallopeptidase [Secundilactobacillus pentosiphilus]GAX03456.1 D-alanyl-D-alanine dipeptidase [Secundilactobacillus pentosiphilus]GAX06024.1 D-alanyl-D-alanine dipeptidase [Secundilactobacillus pentosiphilus]